MDLIIKGYIPGSMLDWEGKLASVLFTGGCNWQCFYCHNADLVQSPDSLPDIPFKRIKEHLLSRQGWLDGCVITGGEPLIHSWLPELIEKIKSLGFKVKLDTNGVLSGALKQLLKKKLVDYVAMDIKTSFAKYEQVVQSEVKPEDIKESVAALRESGIEHEFRTTVVPQFAEKDDLIAIAKFIQGSKAYFLQQFKPNHTLEPQARDIIPYDEGVLQEMAKDCSKYVKTRVRC